MSKRKTTVAVLGDTKQMVSNYEKFTMKRPDMTPEQKKAAIEKYRARVSVGAQAAAQ